MTLPNSASDLGSAELSPGEPMYDVIGELPLAALYEEILECKDGAPGEDGRAVAAAGVGGVSPAPEGPPGGGAEHRAPGCKAPQWESREGRVGCWGPGRRARGSRPRAVPGRLRVPGARRLSQVLFGDMSLLP